MYCITDEVQHTSAAKIRPNKQQQSLLKIISCFFKLILDYLFASENKDKQTDLPTTRSVFIRFSHVII
jgi:hypothetical protein